MPNWRFTFMLHTHIICINAQSLSDFCLQKYNLSILFKWTRISNTFDHWWLLYYLRSLPQLVTWVSQFRGAKNLMWNVLNLMLCNKCVFIHFVMQNIHIKTFPLFESCALEPRLLHIMLYELCTQYPDTHPIYWIISFISRNNSSEHWTRNTE